MAICKEWWAQRNEIGLVESMVEGYGSYNVYKYIPEPDDRHPHIFVRSCYKLETAIKTLTELARVSMGNAPQRLPISKPIETQKRTGVLH